MTLTQFLHDLWNTYLILCTFLGVFVSVSYTFYYLIQAGRSANDRRPYR